MGCTACPPPQCFMVQYLVEDAAMRCRETALLWRQTCKQGCPVASSCTGMLLL